MPALASRRVFRIMFTEESFSTHGDLGQSPGRTLEVERGERRVNGEFPLKTNDFGGRSALAKLKRRREASLKIYTYKCMDYRANRKWVMNYCGLQRIIGK